MMMTAMMIAQRPMTKQKNSCLELTESVLSSQIYTLTIQRQVRCSSAAVSLHLQTFSVQKLRHVASVDAASDAYGAPFVSFPINFF